jgi:hypothetical protein
MQILIGPDVHHLVQRAGLGVPESAQPGMIEAALLQLFLVPLEELLERARLEVVGAYFVYHAIFLLQETVGAIHPEAHMREPYHTSSHATCPPLDARNRRASHGLAGAWPSVSHATRAHLTVLDPSGLGTYHMTI